MDFKIGQKLWFQNRDTRCTSYYVTISKIGKKWIYADLHKINKDTLVVDGERYSSPGKCYESKEEYERQNKLDKEWHILRNQIERINWKIEITSDVMFTIRKLLNIKE